MAISSQPDIFVAAVSGGVDSAVLLHMLAHEAMHPESQRPNKGPFRLVVAHYDHGIRPDSREDRLHVQNLAKQYGLPFMFDEGSLGEQASEAEARKARYDYLHSVREHMNAKAIVTAHHQDDVIETALLNMLRGTHRRGLSSLKSTDVIKRPLLHMPKRRLISYARVNGLVWREDSTNLDTRYKRNLVRHQLVYKMTPLERQHILAHLRRMKDLNREIDEALANHLHMQPSHELLDRKYVMSLPFSITVELVAAWLRRAGMRTYDRRLLQRVAAAIKTYQPGRRIVVNGDFDIEVHQRSLALVHHKR